MDSDVITAVAVVEPNGSPLIITADADGTMRSWRIPSGWGALGGPTTAQPEVRRVSFGSPLDLEILVPAVPATLAFLRYAIRTLWTFPIELKIHTLEMRTKLREAEEEFERLEETGEVDDFVEAARDAVIDAWNMIDATLTEADDEDDAA